MTYRSPRDGRPINKLWPVPRSRGSRSIPNPFSKPKLSFAIDSFIEGE
jgi:hypothetical protein